MLYYLTKTNILGFSKEINILTHLISKIIWQNLFECNLGSFLHQKVVINWKKKETLFFNAGHPPEENWEGIDWNILVKLKGP